MKKYINKKVAKRMVIFGAILYAISFIMNLVGINSVAKMSSCIGSSNPCMATTNLTLARVAAGIGYLGIAIFIIGLVLLIISKKES